MNEIAANIAAVRGRIDAAARAAGRDPAGITLIAVTKTFPAECVQAAYDAGLTNMGESKAQEGALKSAPFTQLPLTWHFIGRLQRNKVKQVVSFADVVQSVDRSSLVEELATRAASSPRFAGTPLRILLQVDLDPARAATQVHADSPRGGAHPDAVLQLADQVAAHPALQLDGVMAVAPREHDPAPCFAALQGISARLQTVHPAASVISAGMSGDLESAIANGATWVRVGAALFGSRPLISATTVL